MNSTYVPNPLLTSQLSLLSHGSNNTSTQALLLPHLIPTSSSSSSTPEKREETTTTSNSSSLLSSPHQSGISYEGRLRVLSRGPFDIDHSNGRHHQESLTPSNGQRSSTSSFNAPGNLSLSVSVTSVSKREDDENESTSQDSLIQQQQRGRLGSDPLERLQEICNNKSIESPPPQSFNADNNDDDVSAGPFTCHLCTFSSFHRDDFNSHVNGHYEFRCQKCEFMTKDEREYRSHLKAQHDLTPEAIEDAEQGVRVPRINSQGKVKTFKCKQCEFTSVTKKDFWEHTKEHMNPEKILKCPKCPFVTEYKHHMEYHVRNHFGSKPFTCPNCIYSCVNKSMLNSHMKSHTTIYQYRCLDCTYATKYCHSLKLHLRKYGHKPSVVLNEDGTPNPLPIIDVYGTRRGPKAKKDVDKSSSTFPTLPPHVLAQLQQSVSLSSSSSLLLPSSESKSVPASSFTKSDVDRSNNGSSSSSSSRKRFKEESSMKCNICNFETTIPDIFDNHMILHDIKESESSSQSPPEAAAAAANRFKDEHEDEDDDGEEEEEEEEEGNEETDTAPASPAFQYLEYLKRMAPLLATQQPSLASSSPAESDKEPSSPQPPRSGASSDILSRLYLESFLKRYQQAQTPESDAGSGGGGGGGGNGNGSGSGGALDLSQAQDMEGSSTPVNDQSPAGSKSRRKGKAFKIKRSDSSKAEEEEEEENGGGNKQQSSSEGERGVAPRKPDANLSGNYTCPHCEIAFSCSVMHGAHMGYHDYDNPLKCFECGKVSESRIDFFLHISQKAHESS